MEAEAVAVNVAVKDDRNDLGRIAQQLYGLFRDGAPRRTRTYNPRIKSPRS
jgi:hypothetical protein